MEEFRRKWLGANICFGCKDGCAISTRMIDEMIEDIQKEIIKAKFQERNRIKSDLLRIADEIEGEELRYEVEQYFKTI